MPDLKAMIGDSSRWPVLAGVLFALLMTNAFHEGGHALAAWWGGDRRESIRRRCTLNPIRHFHWFLTLVLPLLTIYFFGFGIGGARPVLVDAGRLGARKMAVVAIAGPTGNFLFTGICLVLISTLLHFGAISDLAPLESAWWRILIPGMCFSVMLGFLNLVPIPPLDGSRIVGLFMPERVRMVWYALAPVGLIAVLVLWLWFSGGLYSFGFKAFGMGYPSLLMDDLPNAIWEQVDRMQSFWERIL